MAFVLNVYVDPRAAIPAGKSCIGAQTLEVSDDDLKTLSEAARLLLSDAVLHGTSVGKEVPLIEPTFAEIRRALETQVARQEQAQADVQAAAKKAAREAEEALAARRKADSDKAVRIILFHKWVEKHGDENQKARMQEGLLPEEEILEGVQEQLFDELDFYEQYVRMHQADVCNCGCADAVVFSIRDTVALTRDQYDKLSAIRQTAPKTAQLTPRVHHAECECLCKADRPTVRVDIEWNGYLLGREYVL